MKNIRFVKKERNTKWSTESQRRAKSCWFIMWWQRRGGCHFLSTSLFFDVVFFAYFLRRWTITVSPLTLAAEARLSLRAWPRPSGSLGRRSLEVLVEAKARSWRAGPPSREASAARGLKGRAWTGEPSRSTAAKTAAPPRKSLWSFGPLSVDSCAATEEFVVVQPPIG